MSDLSWAEWIAVVPLIGSAIAWSYAAVIRARAYRREQDQREWERLRELLVILHNANHEHGRWAQLAAVAEFEHLSRRKRVASTILRQARDHWASAGDEDELNLAIDDALGRAERKWTIWNRLRLR